MAEVQTCPRRMSEVGPWEYAEGLDTWEANRWTDDHDAAEREREDFRRRNPTGGCSGTMGEWLGPGPLPRSCSFCGGAHPDDVIALIEAGWEAEQSTKGYKLYLNPPGTVAARRKLRAEVNSGTDMVDAMEESTERVWQPVPPVKVYMQHFSQAQADRANAALKAAKERREAN